MESKKQSKKKPSKGKDELKEELLKVYEEFKDIQNQAQSGLLDRLIARRVKGVDTSKLEDLLKGE